LKPDCIVLTAMFGRMFPPENILRAGFVIIMKDRGFMLEGLIIIDERGLC